MHIAFVPHRFCEGDNDYYYPHETGEETKAWGKWALRATQLCGSAVILARAAVMSYYRRGGIVTDFDFSQFWRLRCPKSRCQQIFPGLQMAESREREEAIFLVFLLVRAWILSWGLHPHDLISSQRPYDQMPSYWGLGFPHITLGRAQASVRNRSHSLMDFPGGPVAKNLPANAGDTGLSPGLRRCHMAEGC